MMILVFFFIGLINAQNFTVVVIPDTQKYTLEDTDIFSKQTQWIVDNKDSLNIQMVLHVGDMVEYYDDKSEWKLADESMSILDGEVPYLISPGNHDFDDVDLKDIENIEKTIKNYENYFGYKRFEDYEWYKGHYPEDSNRNSYSLLNINGMKFGFLALRLAPTEDELDWANKIVSNNPDYRFIIVTHTFVHTNSQLNAVGNAIWEGFAQKWENIFLVVCGHAGGEGFNTRVGINGNLIFETVFGILSNYQTNPPDEYGKLRYYEFVPLNNKIYVYTYNVNKKEYRTSSNSQFTIDYDMNGELSNEKSSLTISNIASSEKEIEKPSQEEDKKSNLKFFIIILFWIVMIVVISLIYYKNYIKNREV